MPAGDEAAVQTNPPDKRIRFGRYEITRPIGQGGMGTVYEARDPELGRRVAIKVLQGFAGSRELDRFRLEAEAMAKLRHSGIVSIFDVGREEGQPYLVMELVEGESLQKIVEGGSLGRRALIEALHQTAEAVAFANAQGVVHRDLKPANIMVTPRGEAKVMDFGLAKLLEEREEGLSISGQPLGTPSYMSPEQACGRWHDIDSRTDVWGFGATLYFTLTRQAPFRADSVNATLNRVVSMEPRSPRAIDSTIDVDIETVCLKALEKARESRYAGMRELADDLRRYLAGEPVVARRPGPLERVGRFARRRWRWLVAVAAALLLAVGTAWGLYSFVQKKTFTSARDEALRAYNDGRWSRAYFETERALRIQPDERLTTVLRECRERLVTIEHHDQLLEKLQPLDGLIRDTRQLFYAKAADVRAKLIPLEKALEDHEKLMARPEFAGFGEGWRTLGLGWYLVGNTSRAERALEEAQKHLPNDGWTNLHLGKIRLERALMALLAVGGREPADCVSPEDVQQHLLGQGEVRQARARVWTEKALECLRRPASSWEGASEMDRHIASAYLAFATRDFTSMERLCEEGLKRYASEVGREEYWFLRGMSLEGEKAFEAYSKAIDLRPHYAWAWFGRGGSRDAKDFEGWLADYSQALRINPYLAMAYYNRGHALLALGRHAEAAEDFSSVIGLEPTYVPAYNDRAVIRMHLKDFVGAAADLDEALRLHPQYGRAHYTLGLLHESQAHFTLALKDYGEAIRFSPTLIDAYLNRANLLLKMGQVASAIKLLNEAIARKGDSAEVYLLRGLAKKEQQDFAGASADFAETLRRDEKNADAYKNRGILYSQQGKFDLALADFSALIKLVPSAEAYALRGFLWATKGEPEHVIEDLTESIKLDPKNARVFYTRGWAHVTIDIHVAIEDFTEAIKLDQNYADAYYRRAAARALMGDEEGELSDYKKALEVAPKDWRRRAEVEAYLREKAKEDQ